MAEAAVSLSPKALDRIRRHRHAIMTFARMRAKKAVVEQLRAQGLKPQYYSARDIALLTEDYMAQHRAKLIADAEQAIETWREFARWRCAELSSDAQTQNARNSMGSTLQISGAK